MYSESEEESDASENSEIVNEEEEEEEEEEIVAEEEPRKDRMEEVDLDALEIDSQREEVDPPASEPELHGGGASELEAAELGKGRGRTTKAHSSTKRTQQHHKKQQQHHNRQSNNNNSNDDTGGTTVVVVQGGNGSGKAPAKRGRFGKLADRLSQVASAHKPSKHDPPIRLSMANVSKGLKDMTAGEVMEEEESEEEHRPSKYDPPRRLTSEEVRKMFSEGSHSKMMQSGSHKKETGNETEPFYPDYPIMNASTHRAGATDIRSVLKRKRQLLKQPIVATSFPVLNVELTDNGERTVPFLPPANHHEVGPLYSGASKHCVVSRILCHGYSNQRNSSVCIRVAEPYAHINGYASDGTHTGLIIVPPNHTAVFQPPLVVYVRPRDKEARAMRGKTSAYDESQVYNSMGVHYLKVCTDGRTIEKQNVRALVDQLPGTCHHHNVLAHLIQKHGRTQILDSAHKDALVMRGNHYYARTKATLAQIQDAIAQLHENNRRATVTGAVEQDRFKLQAVALNGFDSSGHLTVNLQIQHYPKLRTFTPDDLQAAQYSKVSYASACGACQRVRGAVHDETI